MSDTNESRWEGGWQENAIRDLQETTLSLSAIGLKYGRHKETIYKLARQSKITRPDLKAKSGPVPVSEVKPFSPQHRALGIRLTIFRGGLNFTQMGEKLNLSRHAIKRMELGIWDFTLLQLLEISELLETPISKMLETYKIPVAPIPKQHWR